jgi:hypothetical protein
MIVRTENVGALPTSNVVAFPAQRVGVQWYRNLLETEPDRAVIEAATLKLLDFYEEHDLSPPAPPLLVGSGRR